jgi:hypothetical protein
VHQRLRQSVKKRDRIKGTRRVKTEAVEELEEGKVLCDDVVERVSAHSSMMADDDDDDDDNDNDYGRNGETRDGW